MYKCSMIQLIYKNKKLEIDCDNSFWIFSPAFILYIFGKKYDLKIWNLCLDCFIFYGRFCTSSYKLFQTQLGFENVEKDTDTVGYHM